MKKIISSVLLASMVFTSCESEITSLNDNPKEANSATSDQMFTAGAIGLATRIHSLNSNENHFRYFTQQFTGVQYPAEAKYDLLTRNVPQSNWNSMYIQLNKLNIGLNALSSVPSSPVVENKRAALELMKAYAYSVLVDTYGDVPYSEALNAVDNVKPKYDDAKTIYMDLISKIDNQVLAKLTLGAGGFGANDPFFGGSEAKIKKFANTLKLRIGLNLADVDPVLAKATVASAVVSGVITSNADNVGLKFDKEGLYTNPVYQDLVQSGRNDYIPADTYVDYLNSTNDPRRDAYFNNKISGAYVGGKYGKLNSYAAYSHFNDAIALSDARAEFFDAAEANIMLAEAVERGFIGGSAATYYTAAIQASLDYWKVSPADQATYLAANNYNALPGTWKEKIGLQAWVITFNRGFESWEFSRRLDFKTFTPPANNAVPVRLPYPVAEGSINNTNRSAAVTKQWSDITKDTQSSKVFWDKF
jgi:Starch-binding associating with outer membrane